jgi:hypothetical protein
MGAFPEHIVLTSERYYPKVLICALTRINKNEMFNNNLLLCNIFAGPSMMATRSSSALKEKIISIYENVIDSRLMISQKVPKQGFSQISHP